MLRCVAHPTPWHHDVLFYADGSIPMHIDGPIHNVQLVWDFLVQALEQLLSHYLHVMGPTLA